MSRIKISENIFLETQELNRFMRFLSTDGYLKLMKSIITQYGIVKNDQNTNFKVSDSGVSKTISIKSGIAFDSNLQAIELSDDLTVLLQNNGVKKWLILSRNVTNQETGTVSLSTDGTLVGANTNFLEVLRGQKNFPVKVKLNSAYNVGEYEVISVSDDTNAVLSGSFTQAESGLKYSVIGCFTPGFFPSAANKYIYEYDYYNISIIDSVSQPTLSDDQFLLASVEFDSSDNMTIVDLRNDYLMKITASYSTSLTEAVTSVSPITSMIRTTLISSGRLELEFEHGYTINSYNYVNNILTITSGTCNFYGTSTIPNNVFKNWRLINYANMKTLTIDSNTGFELSISEWDDTFLETSGNVLRIIPDCLDIEFKLQITGTDIRNPIYRKFSIENILNRFDVPVTLGSNIIKITYRFINGKKTTSWMNLSQSSFVNVNGLNEILANSYFTATIV